MRRISLTIASAVLIAGLIFAMTPLASAAGNIGGRPANPDPENPRSSSIFIYTLDPGSKHQDQVLLSNSGNQRQTVELYAVDATTTNSGSLACLQQTETSTDVGNWVTPTEEELALEPGQERAISFNITVPADTSPGEHGGCLVFQQKADTGEVHGNIRIRTRQAVRIAITVPGEIHKKLILEDFTASHGQYGAAVGITLKNTGNVSADTNVQVTVRNSFGKTVYTNGGAYPVFGGKKLDLRFDDTHRPFWGGIYTAKAEVSYDKRPGVFSLKDSDQLVTLTSTERRFFITPSTPATLLIAAAIAIPGLLFAWRIRRQRHIKSQQKRWQTYTVGSQDTLETLAKAHHTTWKKLATVNRLKPPYQLREGQHIKLPLKPDSTNQQDRKS